MFRFLAAVMVAGSALANGVVRGVVIDPAKARIGYPQREFHYHLTRPSQS